MTDTRTIPAIDHTCPDPWHVAEDGVTVRDGNRLTVCVCLGPEVAKAMVHDRDQHIALWMLACGDASAVEDSVSVTVTLAEHATLLAALRFWQRVGKAGCTILAQPESDIADACGAVTPLTVEDIDALAERINCA